MTEGYISYHRKRIKEKSLYVYVLTVLFTALPLYATMINPLHWKQMALGCDFAGIVECTTAGGIVAEYKVIETWKGTKHSEPIRIQVGLDYWEPHYPMVLVGEKLIVFGWKNQAPDTHISTTEGTIVPLWWRNIDYDYETPLYQGIYPIDKQQRIPGYDFGYRDNGQENISVDVIKKNVQELLSGIKQEQDLLRVYFQMYFLEGRLKGYQTDMDILSRHKNSKETDKSAEDIKDLEERIKQYEAVIPQLWQLNQELQQCTDSIQIIDKICDFSIRCYDEFEYSLRALLRDGIQTLESLEHLKKRFNTTSNLYPNDENRKYLIESIQKRLVPSINRTDVTQTETQTYTFEELDKHQAVLENPANKAIYDWAESYGVLVDNRPLFVAEWLAKWKNPLDDRHDENLGYLLASDLAYHCKQDRPKCFEILLHAKEPYVRVAGAVYLCFENEEKGVQHLKTFQYYSGNPGLWAALNQARRGDKQSMEITIRKFRKLPPMDELTTKTAPLFVLLSRAMVLLSNSAAYSNVPQPPNAIYESNYSDLLEWWKKYSDKLTLYDPWFDILKKQKID